MRCPVCGAELVKTGYPDELGYQRYRCPNNCEFWKTLRWKARAFAGDAVGLIVEVGFLLLLLPFALLLLYAEKIEDYRKKKK